MSKAGDSFVAEDFLRAGRGDIALWTVSSLIVIAGLAGGYWVYKTFVPAEELAGPPAGAIVVEFVEFPASPAAEDLDVPEGELANAAEATPPNETEPATEAEPIEEPPVETETAVAEEPIKAPAETPAEPIAKPAPAPVEPPIDVPEMEVEEPPVVIQRVAALPRPEEVLEPEPAPEEPIAEPVDPNLPVPATMSQRVAEIRANTPATEFKPPPPRAPPPQQATTQASAPKPQAQQTDEAAAPQQAPSSEPSASQVNRWESSVLRHLGQRRKYPPEARRRGEAGRVLVQFTIDTAGNVQSVSIAGSSGFASLDQAALELVRSSSPVPRPPEGLPRSRLTIGIPLDYGR